MHAGLGAVIAIFQAVNHIFIFIRHSWFSSGDEELLVVLRRHGSIRLSVARPSGVDTCGSENALYVVSLQEYTVFTASFRFSLLFSSRLCFICSVSAFTLQGLYGITALSLSLSL